MIAAYIRAKELLEQSQKEFDEAVKNGENTTWLTEDLQYNIDAIDDYSQALDENISDLQEKRVALENEYNKAIEKRRAGIEPLTSSEKEVIETYESIYDLMRMVYEYTNQNACNNMEISNIFNTKDIEKTKDELIAMYKAGELSSKEALQQYPKLYEAIKESEIIIGEETNKFKEFYNEIAALADKQADVVNNIVDETRVSLFANEMVDQLNTRLKPAFDKLGSAYQDIFTTDGFDIDAVDIPMLEDLRSTLEDLNDAEDLDINIDMGAFDDFSKILTDANTTEEQAQQAFDNLATSLFYATSATEGMSEETLKLVEQLLESLGVTNAEEVAIYALKDAKAQAILATYDLTDVTRENSDAT